MNLLITGAGGFLGNQLARELRLRRELDLGTGPRSIAMLHLADLGFAPRARDGFGDDTRFHEGDVGSRAFIDALMATEPDIVFHLAAMVSGDGERDFDGCLRANLDGTHSLFEACRATGRPIRVVFASSLAVFGGHPMSPVVSDSTKPLPQTTYGMTKLIGELLLNDYSRKGFLDGRAARLPTVFIRPGKPNAAASSFASGLFREPLAGERCELPVPRSWEVPLLGYRRVVSNLVRLACCDGRLLGDDRTVTLPSTRYRIDAMIAALEEVAGERGLALGPIEDAPDDTIMRIVKGWPIGTDASRIPALGLESDSSVQQVIREYLDDFG